MDAARWQQVKGVFQASIEKQPGDRARFLDGACAGDPGLRAEVETLLAAHHEVGTFLEAPAAAEPTAGELMERLQRAVAGRYSLEREIGSGGMAIVFLARDVALDRLVAIKLLPPRLAANPDFRARFLREARTAAGLAHPNIVPIHHVDEADGLVFFVMTFVEGESLGERVRRAGPLRPAEAARMVQEVSWALSHAHGRGVIHRDIKPDNILLEKGSGRALVTDFGIASVASSGDESRGEIMGTLAWMSPEQAHTGAHLDGRSDLYSLGATAFYALTGRLPFESRAALASVRGDGPAPPVRSVSAVVPMKLAEAVDRCLAKDPAERYDSGAALAEAIAEGQLTRREIAPSVRELLGATRTGMAQAGLLAGVWMGIGASGAPTSLGGWILLVNVAAITPLALLQPFLAARGVVRAGLDEHDVGEAVANSNRDANVEYEIERAGRIAKVLAKPPGRLLFAAAAIGVPVVTVATGAFADLLRWGASLQGLSLLIYLSLSYAAELAFFIPMAIAPEKTVATLTRGTPEYARFFKRIWEGRAGHWFLKLAGIGVRKNRALPAPAADAPTEVLLGRAAGELFDQLTDDQRRRLGDVHAVIGCLERTAALLRSRRDAIRQALADAGPAGDSPRREQLTQELETARDATEKRLGAAVAALENLRLDLLRLRAGLGRPDDLTASLQEARAVGDAVDIEVAARREMESAMIGP